MDGMRKQRGCRKSRGVTLLEATLATVLLGTISLAFGYLYANSQRYVNQAIQANSAQMEIHAALEHIKRTLLQTVTVATPQEGATANELRCSILRSRTGQPVNASYTLNEDNNGIRFLQYQEGNETSRVAFLVTRFEVRRPNRTQLVVTVVAGGERSSATIVLPQIS
jgi:type II secretory pathway pseudopilin PulG